MQKSLFSLLHHQQECDEPAIISHHRLLQRANEEPWFSHQCLLQDHNEQGFCSLSVSCKMFASHTAIKADKSAKDACGNSHPHPTVVLKLRVVAGTAEKGGQGYLRGTSNTGL